MGKGHCAHSSNSCNKATQFYKYQVMTLKYAAGMDMETFTNTFKDPNNRKCIETPLHMWDGSDIGIP
jgi:hypothetical protein